VFFLDESGFGLSLPPTYAWARKGEAVRVPRAWGKSGRVNAVAHLERRSCGGWGLGYALLEGRCGTGEVVAYLEGLSREVAREGVRGVVYLALLLGACSGPGGNHPPQIAAFPLRSSSRTG
jgi:hypothetical protein